MVVCTVPVALPKQEASVALGVTSSKVGSPTSTCAVVKQALTSVTERV